MVGGLKFENKRLRTRWYSLNSLYTTNCFTVFDELSKCDEEMEQYAKMM